MMNKYGPPPEVYSPPHYGHHGYPPAHNGHHGYPPTGQPNHGYSQQPQQLSNNLTFAPTINQPQTQSTNVVVNTGGVGGLKRKRLWTTGICGCMQDMGGCLCVICCTSCQLMMLASRMDELFCLPCVVPQALMAMRVKLREANRIQGGIFNDCLLTSCCPLMSICQMKREMDNIDRRKPGTEL